MGKKISIDLENLKLIKDFKESSDDYVNIENIVFAIIDYYEGNKIVLSPLESVLFNGLKNDIDKVLVSNEKKRESIKKRWKVKTVVKKPKTIKTELDLAIEKIETQKLVPTFEEFKAHADSKKVNYVLEDLKLKYDAWVENGWKDGNNNKIKSWKSKLSNTLKYLKKDEKFNSSKRVAGSYTRSEAVNQEQAFLDSIERKTT